MKNTAILLMSVISLSTFGQKKEALKVTEKELKPVEIKSIHDDDVIDLAPAVYVEEKTENPLYTVASVETHPEFPGGIKAFDAFLSKNIVISEEMKSEEIRKKVYISFVVEKDGSITDIKILRDFGFDSGKEAIRVLKMMPKWIPAQMNGKKVRCTYTVPITFDATKTTK